MGLFKKKGPLVLGLLVATGLLFVAGAMLWVHYELEPGAAAQGSYGLNGYTGLQPLLPILIALIAIAVTLTIAAKIARVALGVLIVALGGWIGLRSFLVALGDQQSLVSFGQRSLAEITGISGKSLDQAVLAADVSFWPVASGALAIIVGVQGVLIVIFGFSWQTGGRKYEVQRQGPLTSANNDRISDWDSLSEGIDPSEAVGPGEEMEPGEVADPDKA